MTKDPKKRGEELFNQDEEQLDDELESLYRKVASHDSPEAASGDREDSAVYYKILQIPPDASLSEIHRAFEKITSAWDPERYPHISSWKETSAKKLQEIRNAYEKLLILREAGEAAGSEDSDRSSPSTALLSFPVDSEPEEEAASPRPNIRESIESMAKRRPWLLPSGAAIVILLLLSFVWPTFYHYETVRVGDNAYPLRINRMTSHARYYDGRQWLELPLRVRTPGKVSPVIPTPPATAEPTGTVIQVPENPPQPPPLKEVSPQAVVSPPSVQPGEVGTRIEPAKEPPAPAKRQSKPPAPAAVKAKSGGLYSIQIGAYTEKDKADDLAEEVRAKKFAVRVEEVSIPGKGLWHRVLLGQFKNRAAALRYLKDRRIGETYPGSFVQKSVVESGS